MSDAIVFIVERGLVDSPNDPGSEIVGVFSTREKADRAARSEAPESGWVTEYTLDAVAL